MFEQVVLIVAALSGFAALFVFIVNALKAFGIIKDGQAATWITGFNVVLTLVVYGFKLFKPDFDFGSIDPIAQEIAIIGTYILSFVSQILASKLTHYAVKGTPIIGFSYSEQHKLVK